MSSNSSRTMTTNQLRCMFLCAVDSVKPETLVRNALQTTFAPDGKSERLVVADRSYPLRQNVHLIAFGKAAWGMSHTAESILKNHLMDGVASVPFGTLPKKVQTPEGTFNPILRKNSVIDSVVGTITQYYEGARDNLPDQPAYETALKIRSIATGAQEGELVLVLISGGGSALLPCPVQGLSLADKVKIIQLLSLAGATIQELNCVRTSLSRLKGGKLALLARPAAVIALIMSDIIGNPLGLIASGPTAAPPASGGDAWEILAKYKLLDAVKWGSIVDHNLVSRAGGAVATTMYDHVQNVVIGDNSLALAKAAEYCRTILETNCFVVTSALTGEASEVAKGLVRLSSFILKAFSSGYKNGNCDIDAQSLEAAAEGLQVEDMSQFLTFLCGLSQQKDCGQSFCLMFGGETTVTVRGSGKGGRNQEMALAWLLAAGESGLATLLPNSRFSNLALLSGGTDGIDGPTDAAGAIVSLEDLYSGRFAEFGVKNARECLENNDSYRFWKEFKLDPNERLEIGLTGTNVMDLQFLYFVV